uniref:Movement protein n=1 Tax=Strawberry vein banding virus TaxID=47903 RepID=D4IIG9_9VIRU|nr:putative movement protein [Strawberry vein banding virus]UCJ01185.1 putative movement protein [Strawberry vein banding virus]UCJ01192.1 putative movement protein [Strawberry vein banding virus]UCJ01199.1 putative movement protein [Strawberry vein banding virus]UCJ01206.1 putative movement protein [Strawberry vein banding virus]
MSEEEIRMDQPQEGHDEYIFEEEGTYAHDVAIDSTLLNQIEKKDLELTSEEVFKTPSLWKKFLKARKNICIACVSSREYPIEITQANGLTEIPFFNREEIESKKRVLKPEDRKKIDFIHIGSIKIMIKSTFRTGIDSPISVALLDRRMKNANDAVFGGVKGNLSYGKLIFTYNPKIGVSLRDPKINNILTLAHFFERESLMHQGNHPYTISYKLGYILSNSHHSMEFRPKEPICIDDLFSTVGKISHAPLQEISPIENYWSMNLGNTSRRLLGERPRMIVIEDDEEETPLDRHRERALARSQSRMLGLRPPDDLRTTSRRINTLAHQL